MWVAINKDGTERVFKNEPVRIGDLWIDKKSFCQTGNISFSYGIPLKKGYIKNILGCYLTWKDLPHKVEHLI